MEKIRTWMVAAGLAIVIVGAAWVAHGTGVIRLPATGFMNELSVWTINGSLAIAFGLIVIVGSWKLLRNQPRETGFGDDHFLGEP